MRINLKFLYFLIYFFIFLKVIEIFTNALLIGYNIDEPYHLIDGQNWLKHFSYVSEYDTSYIYGPLIGGASNLINTLIGNGSIGSYVHNALTFEVTHLIVATLGILGTLIFLLIVKFLPEYKYIGFFSTVFLFSIPFWTGNTFHNIKDVPVATGYTFVSIGLTLILIYFKSKKMKLLAQILLLFGLILIIGTRPAIILPVSISFLFVFCYLKFIKKLKITKIINLFLPVVIPVLVAVPLILPQFLQEPLKSLILLFKGSSAFPWTGTTFTAGKLYEAKFSISYYLWWLFAQTPILILIFILVGLVYFLINFKKINNNLIVMSYLFFIQFMLIPSYSLIMKSSIYNGLRHLLFIYPAMAFFAALGCYALWKYFQAVKIRKVLVLLISIAIIVPNLEAYMLRPYQQLYFNPVISLFYNISTSWETEPLGISRRESVQLIPPAGKVVSTHEWTWEKNAYASERGKLDSKNYELKPGDFWQVTSVASYIGGYSRERMIKTKSPLEAVRNLCSVQNVVSRRLRFEHIPLSIVMLCQNSGKLIPGIASLTWVSQTEIDKNQKPYIWITDAGETIRISNLEANSLKGFFQINLFANPCKTSIPIRISTKLSKFDKTFEIQEKTESINIPLDIGLFKTEEILIEPLSNNFCNVLGDSRNFVVGINKFSVKTKN